MEMGRKRGIRKDNDGLCKMDYVWLFGLEFCTPRYIIIKELAMDKLRVGWKIRARRYEEKVKKGGAGEIANYVGRRKKNMEGNEKSIQ